MAKKTIILCPYPYGKAPSQRFRFEQYIEAYDLQKEYKIRSFYSAKGMEVLYGGNILLKLIYLAFFFVRRKFHVLEALTHKKIFIHRELAPIGPPFYEWILKIFGKDIIYDFDDAIWLSNVSDVNRKFDFTKAYWKVKYNIKWAKKVTVGNAYLKAYADQFNKNVQLLPSTVDMENIHNQVKEVEDKEVIRIGWTGSHTTAAKYLPQMVPVLKILSSKYKLEFAVISNHEPEIALDNLIYIPWSAQTELSDLISFDIGIMPLGNEEWEKGKCSFKAIQYMALGIPTVLSPYGNNVEVVTDEKDGLFATSEQDWINQIVKLIEDVELRKSIGTEAVKTIQENYSLESQTNFYEEVLV
jgi:glycosyltransferase involved in cell wall biosynthesis